LSEHALGHGLRELALVEFALLNDEDLLDPVRAAHQDAPLQHDRHAGDVAVIACDPEQQAEWVPPDLERYSHNRQAFWSGWNATSIGRHNCALLHALVSLCFLRLFYFEKVPSASLARGVI
jgi:hypothetical protein